MEALGYAIDILEDDLRELCGMQYSPKYSTDEITFKKRLKSLESAIKILKEAK